MSATTRRLVTFSPDERRIWGSRLIGKKQLLTTRRMCCFIIVEVDIKISYNFDQLDDFIIDWKRQVSRQQRAQVSKAAEPMLLRFKRIQLESTWWAPISIMTDGDNFRDLTRSVELFVDGKQVMADKIAYNIYDVLGVGDEF